MKKLKIFEQSESSNLLNKNQQVESIKNVSSIVEILHIEEQELYSLLNGRGSISLSMSQLSLLSIDDRQELYNGFISSESSNSYQTFGNLLSALDSN